MNKKILILFSPFLIASNFGEVKLNKIPTIQVFTSLYEKPTKKFLKKLPLKYQQKCLILKIKKYFAIRCLTNNPKRDLKELKKYAHDAFFIFTKKEAISLGKPQKNSPNDLYLAHFYYRKGNLIKSLELYKSAYAYTKNPQIAINIAYIEGLLGKNPTFTTEKTLYAYSIGAIQSSNTKKLKKLLKTNINFSKEGYIEFVLGYLNENNPKKALYYYQRAYKKNPLNKYFIYALARIYDINKKYEYAVFYYQKISKCNDNICKIAKKRIRQLLQ